MKEHISGELQMDIHGNITDITDSGTYVLRDGKLVKGQGESRESA